LKRKDCSNCTILDAKKSKRTILREAQAMVAKICIVGLMSCGMAVGQAASGPTAGVSKAEDAAKAVKKPIRFEVVSVRPSKTFGGHGFTDDGFDGNFNVSIYIGMAYGLINGQKVLGLPGWCNTELYEVKAKVAEADIAEWQKPGSTTPNDALRALLEDRFKLKAHFETRDAPAYALVVAKNGPKFKAATPGETYPNGLHTGSGKTVYGEVGQKTYPDGPLIGQAAPISQLVQYMNSAMNTMLGRQVVDKTGLTGQYDFTMPMYPGYTPWMSKPPADDSTPSIFTVIQDSLGLKLEPTTAPVEFLVIDHIERPSEN
jgi:uncharacterized protein (TIGR03435 family)